MGKFDWKSIVRSVAPTIASALGGPLAGMAVRTISEALLGKTDASENEVAAAIADTNNPDMLLKLKQAENEFAAKMKQLDIDLEKIAAEDRANARQREAAVRDKTPMILAYVYTIGYFVVLSVVWGSNVPANAKETFNILLGILSAAEVGIISYYFGSSAGSSRKSDTIDRLTEKG